MGFCLANGRHQFDRGASSSIRFLPFVLNFFWQNNHFNGIAFEIIGLLPHPRACAFRLHENRIVFFIHSLLVCNASHHRWHRWRDRLSNGKPARTGETMFIHRPFVIRTSFGVHFDGIFAWSLSTRAIIIAGCLSHSKNDSRFAYARLADDNFNFRHSLHMQSTNYL